MDTYGLTDEMAYDVLSNPLLKSYLADGYYLEDGSGIGEDAQKEIASFLTGISTNELTSLQSKLRTARLLLKPLYDYIDESWLYHDRLRKNAVRLREKIIEAGSDESQTRKLVEEEMKFLESADQQQQPLSLKKHERPLSNGRKDPFYDILVEFNKKLSQLPQSEENGLKQEFLGELNDYINSSTIAYVIKNGTFWYCHKERAESFVKEIKKSSDNDENADAKQCERDQEGLIRLVRTQLSFFNYKRGDQADKFYEILGAYKAGQGEDDKEEFSPSLT